MSDLIGNCSIMLQFDEENVLEPGNNHINILLLLLFSLNLCFVVSSTVIDFLFFVTTINFHTNKELDNYTKSLLFRRWELAFKILLFKFELLLSQGLNEITVLQGQRILNKNHTNYSMQWQNTQMLYCLAIEYGYCMDEGELVEVEEIRHLGLEYKLTLSFKAHVENMATIRLFLQK